MASFPSLPNTIRPNTLADATKVQQNFEALLNALKDGSKRLGIAELQAGNLFLSGNTITVTNSNGDIILDPPGTGSIILNGPATLSELNVAGPITAEELDVDNIRIDGNTISSTNTGGDINLAPIVDGDVNVTTTGTGIFAVTGIETITGQLNVDNLTLDGNTISSTGNIILLPAIGFSTMIQNLTFDDGNIISDINLILRGANGVNIVADTLPVAISATSFELLQAGIQFKINEGGNAIMGVATLVGGTVVVSTTKVAANSRIFLSNQNGGGTPGALYVSARTAATSFTITSTDGSDTGLIAWLIIDPTP